MVQEPSANTLDERRPDPTWNLVGNTRFRDLTAGELAAAVARAHAGDPAFDVLRSKRFPSLTARWRVEDDSAIVKIWAAEGLKARLARAAYLSGAAREWRHLIALRALGLRVPAVLGFCRTLRFEVLVLEDLGVCERVGEYLGRLVTENENEEIGRIENELVDATAIMVRAGILDTDHSVLNFVVAPDRSIYRLDLECSRRRGSLFRDHLLAEMLGRLVSTFAFAVAPQLDRVSRLADSFAKLLEVRSGVLNKARLVVDRHMELQQRECGVRMELSLSW